MLKTVPSRELQRDVYRMAMANRINNLLEKEGLDPQSIKETKKFLQSCGVEDSVEEVCDAPFKLKPRLHKSYGKSRFSDGSFPVFYSSLETETADAEIQHWFLKWFSSNSRRTVFYYRVQCSFEGNVKDLTTMQEKWSQLTHDSDSDYQFCNELGAEAIRAKLDGFLTPSARNKGGKNVPIFTRESIRDPRLITKVSLTFDPQTKRVTVESLW